MKGKMYRLAGTGLFGKHSNGRFGANTIPSARNGGKLPTPPKSRKSPPKPEQNFGKPDKN